MVQDNMNRQNWSKNQVSQHRPQNSVLQHYFLGTPCMLLSSGLLLNCFFSFWFSSFQALFGWWNMINGVGQLTTISSTVRCWLVPALFEVTTQLDFLWVFVHRGHLVGIGCKFLFLLILLPVLLFPPHHFYFKQVENYQTKTNVELKPNWLLQVFVKWLCLAASPPPPPPPPLPSITIQLSH